MTINVTNWWNGTIPSFCPDFSTLQFFDCQFIYDCPCLPLKADPDVGGIGVVISFIATAALALLVSFVTYLIREMDKAKIYHNLISKWLTLKEREFWTTLLERLLLGFSDQQLITGTAVLLMGFIRLPISNGQISVYHFSIVANLAWFSAVTHAITVLVLQDYFKLPKHYILRNVRILGMIIMGILLVVSLTFCLHTGFQTINCPAQCMILSPDAGKMPSYIALDSQINNTWITISIVFLLLTYLVTIPTLFPPMRRFLQRLRLRFVYIQIAGYTAAVYLTLLFIAGVMTIVRQRRNSRMVMEDDQVQLEDIWGFGQLLSVLMLLLPIFIAIEVYYEELGKNGSPGTFAIKSDEIPMLSQNR